MLYCKNLVRYKKFWPHIIFAILVGVFVLLNNSSLKQAKVSHPSQINNQVSTEKEIARVLRVIDGDTIEAQLNNKKEMVRLIGIDAPETVDPRKTVECFGKQASDNAKEILNGKIITLESDPKQGNRDKYQRLLRYVFLNDLNFNKFMISKGYAHEFTYQNNHYKYMEEFKNSELEARESKKGLWSDVAKCNNE